MLLPQGCQVTYFARGLTTYASAVQDSWLAFEDRLDWSTISLVVHRSNMSSIPQLVQSTDVEVSRPVPKALL